MAKTERWDYSGGRGLGSVWPLVGSVLATLVACPADSETQERAARPAQLQASSPAAASSAQPPPPPPPPADVPVVTEEPAAAERPEGKAPGGRQPHTSKKPVDTNCGGECIGPEGVTARLQSTLRAKAGLARSCYNRALSDNATDLSGSLTVSLRIGRDGAVCSAKIDSDTLGNENVARCVVQRFESGPFPEPQGGCVDVAVPINFVSR